MKNVEQINANQIMNEDPVKAQNDESLSQIKNKMEEKGKRAIPVVDSKNQLEGVIGYRDLIRTVQFNPENTKLSKVMHTPPKFESKDSLVEIADLRINSGRKMLVNLEKQKLKGVISDREILETLDEVKEIKALNVDDVKTEELETVFEQDSIEKVRHSMLDNNISRLPVLDKNGKLTGIVRSTDILKMMVPRENQSSGGRSGNRHGSEFNRSGGGEKDKISDIPVKEMMLTDFNTTDQNISGKDAIEEMQNTGNDEVIIMENGYPDSIVTLKDFVDYLENFSPGNTVLVNLIGLDVDEEKAAAHRQIKKQLQGSLGRKLKRPEEIKLHVKKAEKDGKKHRYEIDMKLFCEYGQITINEEGWDLVDVVDEGLNQMNEVVRRKKQKRTEHD